MCIRDRLLRLPTLLGLSLRMNLLNQKPSLIREFERRLMEWDYKVKKPLRHDYPEEVKKFKGEIGYYETGEGIIRVFRLNRS